MPPFISGSCQGEQCGFRLHIGNDKIICRKTAEHKVEETIFDDDPLPHRHPLTQYLCHTHFRLLMGPAADRLLEYEGP